jgi:hypothetical protein
MAYNKEVHLCEKEMFSVHNVFFCLLFLSLYLSVYADIKNYSIGPRRLSDIGRVLLCEKLMLLCVLDFFGQMSILSRSASCNISIKGPFTTMVEEKQIKQTPHEI